MAPLLRILIIATAHADLGDTGARTGLWLEELSTPYFLFTEGGAQVTIASLPGGEIPLDPHSLEDEKAASAQRFLKDEAATAQLRNSRKLSKLSFQDYDVVFIPGGHGAMWDLASSAELGEFVSNAWARGEIVASVCHGPAGLVQAEDTNGRPLVAGKKISAFSNSEETRMKLDKVVPFALESKLRELGAEYRSGSDFQPFAVRDGRLITGQNPASSQKVAELVFEAAEENTARRES